MANLLITGTITAARRYKEGSKLLIVAIDGREFKAFDETYLRKVGAEGDWYYYKKENEWNGKKTIDNILVSLVDNRPKAQARNSQNLDKIMAKLDDLHDAIERVPEKLVELLDKEEDV